MMIKRIRSNGTFRSALLSAAAACIALLALLALDGCKNGCDGVVCGPSPFPLTVTVRDSITMKVSKPEVDSATSDTTFVLIDSVITTKSGLADVVLVDPANDPANAVSHILHFEPSDSIYRLDDLSGVGGGPYLLVVSRGARSDTVVDLLRKDVEGCCSYTVIGNYSVTMGRE
jgi:hypothetical protein